MIWMILLLPVLFLALAAWRATLPSWIAAGVVWLLVLNAVGGASNAATGTAIVVWLALSSFLLLKPVRRFFFSKPLFGAYRVILPPMSETERVALEAGTVWWEGQLFSGKPDWKTLLSYPSRSCLPRNNPSSIMKPASCVA